MSKLAILSHVVPPMPSGQSMVLGRILQRFKSDEIFLITGFQSSSSIPLTKANGYYETFFLGPILFENKKLEKYLLIVRMILRSWQIRNLLVQHQCDSIVACSGDILDLPAGYLASLWVGIPFYAYLFDDYVYQWTHWAYRFFARCVEPFFIKGAEHVIVPNEFLMREYQSRYGVNCAIVRNPLPYGNDDIAPSLVSNPVTEFREKKIIYMGAVYHVNVDAFRCLLNAIDELTESNVKLHLYTAQSEDQLRQMRIVGRLDIHNHLSSIKEVLVVQKQADILYLPLGFEAFVRQIVITSAPGKMGEYLASGRPILVHAPEDSFVSQYFKKYDCGLVVNDTNPDSTKNAIQSLLNDLAIQERFTKNARIRAMEDFGLSLAQNEFYKIVGRHWKIR